MKSFKGIRLRYFVLVLSLIVIVIGVWQVFFQGHGYVKTKATIVSIEKNDLSADEDNYDVMVSFTVDGKEYSGLLDTYSPSYKVGKTVAIKYDPADPSRFQDDSGLTLMMLAIGVVLLAADIIIWVMEKKKQKELEEIKGRTSDIHYAPSVPGPERKLYFITDLGTPKYGHRIEDQNGRVLYEARMTRFTLFQPYGFDFINYETGRTVPHLIGHEESSEWDSILVDDHHTFTFDGEFIWKHLKRNGITVESSFSPDNPLKTEFMIFRDGVQIAAVQASSQYVHEEEAAEHGKFANALPAFGHYRIRTTETNLDLLFLTILAFARTGATTGEGGSRKTLLNTIFRK